MTIEYHVTSGDCAAFTQDHFNRAKRTNLIKLPIRVMPTLLLPVFIIRHAEESISLAFLMLYAVSCGVWFFVAPMLMDLAMRQTLLMHSGNAAMSGMTGEQTLQLLEDGLEWTHAGQTKSIPYASVSHISFGHGLIYAYISPAKALIIPPQAFDDDEQRHAFVTLLTQRIG